MRGGGACIDGKDLNTLNPMAYLSANPSSLDTFRASHTTEIHTFIMWAKIP